MCQKGVAIYPMVWLFPLRVWLFTIGVAISPVVWLFPLRVWLFQHNASPWAPVGAKKIVQICPLFAELKMSRTESELTRVQKRVLKLVNL